MKKKLNQNHISIIVVILFVSALAYLIEVRKQNNLEIANNTPAVIKFRLDLYPNTLELNLAENHLINEGNFNCISGLKYRILAEVTNSTGIPYHSGFSHDGPFGHPINISYMVTSPSGKTHEGPRSFITSLALEQKHANEVREKGQSLIDFTCPQTAGAYEVKFQLVQEAVAWQEQIDSANIRNYINVKSIPLQQFPAPDQLKKISLDLLDTPTRRTFVMAYALLTHSLSWFPYKHQKYLLAQAGSQYPMVWSRDMYTIDRGLQALIDHQISPFELDRENHWGELFLQEQYEDGQIPDWLAFESFSHQVNKDKNDIQTDQELWTIKSITEALEKERLDPDWLSDSYVAAIEKSFTWLHQKRYNEAQCLWSGHVIDWGDVGLKGKDSSDSTRISHGKPYICSLFHQALFLNSTDFVTQSNHPLKKALSPSIVKTIQQMRNGIRSYILKDLAWKRHQGIFHLHNHIETEDEKNHDAKATQLEQIEKEMFAIGGHVLLSKTNILDQSSRQELMEFILARKKEYAQKTVGAVLTPPYPEGTFENPILSKPYTYQNGGDWDWYGCQIAEFFADLDLGKAEEALDEIARKVYNNGTFYEWDYPNGSPGHGPHFRAGAAAYVKAFLRILEGKKKLALASINKQG